MPSVLGLAGVAEERKALSPRANNADGAAIESLKELLHQQDDQMKVLFAKAINLFVAPAASDTLAREKVDRLRQAVDESLT